MDPIVIKKRFEIDTSKLMDNKVTLEMRNMEVVKCEYPYFIVSMVQPKSTKKYYMCFKCDNYPLSMQVVDPETFEPAKWESWPHGGHFINPHDVTGRPFLCIDGLYEYHTYTGHKHETKWNLLSDEYRLIPMVERVYVKLLNANE